MFVRQRLHNKLLPVLNNTVREHVLLMTCQKMKEISDFKITCFVNHVICFILLPIYTSNIGAFEILKLHVNLNLVILSTCTNIKHT